MGVKRKNDPDRANQLLDGAGYAERDADEFRLWKDGSGETLSFIIEGTSQPGRSEEDSILTIIKYYAKISPKAAPKGDGAITLYRALVGQYPRRRILGRVPRSAADSHAFPLDGNGAGPALGDGVWTLESRRERHKGEPPPAGHFLWKIWKIWDQVSSEPDPATRDELFTQILDIWAEEIPNVGCLGQSPALIIMKDTMHNYISGQPVNDGLDDEHFLNPQLLSWEDPENQM